MCARREAGSKENGGGSETLVTEKRKGKGILKQIVRRLAPLECERLDGFPDGWTEKRKDGRGISDNARYMALGNSIAIPCAVRVFRGIIAAEAEVEEKQEETPALAAVVGAAEEEWKFGE